MNLLNLVAGLKSGKVKLLSKSHLHNDLVAVLERELEHNQKFLKELIEKGKDWIGHDKKPIGEGSESMISL